MRKVFDDLQVRVKRIQKWCEDLFDLEDSDELEEQRRADKEQDRYGMRSPPFTYDKRGNKIIISDKKNKKGGDYQ